MAQNPIFQGIRKPAGLLARLKSDLEFLFNNDNPDEYDAVMREVIYIFEQQTGVVISLNYPPEIIDIQSDVNGSYLLVTFNMFMHAESEDSDDKWSITSGGRSIGVSDIQIVNNLQTLQIFLDGQIYKGETILVSYTSGIQWNVKSFAEVDLVSFVDMEGTNKVLFPMLLEVDMIPSISDPLAVSTFSGAFNNGVTGLNVDMIPSISDLTATAIFSGAFSESESLTVDIIPTIGVSAVLI